EVRSRLRGPALPDVRPGAARARALPAARARRRRPHRGRDGGEGRARARAARRAHEQAVRVGPADAVRARMTPKVAVCPGTYDPVTFGHLDVIKRVAGIFDRVIVAVVHDALHKGGTLFEPEERIAFLEDGLVGVENVEIELFSELLVDFARRHD